MKPSQIPAIDPHEFVERLALAVWQALYAVRWLEGRVKNRPKPSEVTPEKAALTDADCVSQEVLLVALRTWFPDVRLNVEEDTPSVELFADSRGADLVVVDPIDGTLRYLLGDGPYAILVGLERAGRVEAALVGVPQREIVIRAVRGHGAQIARAGGAFEPARLDGKGPDVLVSYGLPRPIELRLRNAGARIVTAAGGVIGVAPLLDGIGGALRLAPPRAELSRRAWVASLPTLEAGGRVEGLTGAFPERYEPGVRAMLVGSDADAITRLRAVVASPDGP